MERLTKAAKKRSLSASTTNHILWGIVCFGLLLFAAAMWQNIQTLSSQNEKLAKENIALKARDTSCTARDTWKADTTKEFQTITPNGIRSYYVHLPVDFNTNQYYPLIIHYPGKGANGMNGAEQANLNVLPAIVIYPSPSIGIDGYTAWQGAPYSSNADDVSFTGEVLDKVQSQLCIDRDRVYATGISNGGGMVSLLSCRMPDRFAAYGIVSGAMYYPAGDCKPPQPTPLINIHGAKDENVPYQGSVTRGLPNINTWSAERAKDNSCSLTPDVTHPDPVTTVTTWNDCKDGATVQNILLLENGHIWAPNATQLLWQFMSKHTL